MSMRFILISLETFFEKEEVAYNALFLEGLKILHLRKPQSSENDLRNLLTQINSKFHNRIVLHDHFDLLNDFNLKGVHLNRRNPVPPNKKNISISKSCHSLDEVKESAGKFEYVFLSPIFDSISKSGYRQAYSSEELIRAKSEEIINDKVIALGGITIDTIPKVKNYGFGGVAILGGLWSDFEITKDKKALLNRFENYLQAI